MSRSSRREVEEERREARDVWLAVRRATGRPPGAELLARVSDQLADPGAGLVVVRRRGLAVGMGLAEAFTEDGDRGAVRPDWCHVSMVYVRPDFQARGVGREVVGEIIHARPAHTLSLWTQTSNTAATRLYRHHGFVATGDVASLSDGQAIGRWQRPPDG